MWATYRMFSSHHTCPPPGQSICPTSLVFHARPIGRSLEQVDDVAGSASPVACKQTECHQCRFVACDEHDQRILAVVDVLGPRPTRDGKGVEPLQFEAHAIDLCIAATFERRRE